MKRSSEGVLVMPWLREALSERALATDEVRDSLIWGDVSAVDNGFATAGDRLRVIWGDLREMLVTEA